MKTVSVITGLLLAIVGLAWVYMLRAELSEELDCGTGGGRNHDVCTQLVQQPITH